MLCIMSFKRFCCCHFITFCIVLFSFLENVTNNQFHLSMIDYLLLAFSVCCNVRKMFEWILMHCCSPIPDLCENYQFMLITLLAGVCAPCSGFLHHYSLNKNKLFREKLFFFPPFTPTTKVCFYNRHIINAYNITSKSMSWIQHFQLALSTNSDSLLRVARGARPAPQYFVTCRKSINRWSCTITEKAPKGLLVVENAY